MRSSTWLAACGVMISGVVALAQQPMPMQYPNPYGVPGYPAAPSGPPGPMPPYATPPNLPMVPSAPPGGPYGYPMPMQPGGMPYGPMPYGGAGPMPYGGAGSMPYTGPMPGPTFAPPDPRLAPGQKPSALPPSHGSGPQKDATEPYFVLPDSVPPTRGPLLQCFCDPMGSEPYTTYEGRTYMAETRLENSRVWVQANFIHWWVRGDSTPPLVTTTNGNPLLRGAGSLGRDDTVILLGGGATGPREFSGIQATLGMWLDPERLQSLELGGFWLGRNSRQSRFNSDANGNPLLAQPIVDVTPGQAPFENAIAVTFPNVTAGSISVATSMNFYGLEMNLARNLFRLNGWSIDSVVGLRYLYLNDRLDIDQNFTLLPGGAGFVFNGVAQPAGANFVLNDSFNVTNRFYGAQIGARVNWACCNGLDLGAIVKVGFGATTHATVINGSTTVIALDGTSSTLPGASLAQLSNIGRYTSTDFSVVPEVTLTLGYQVTPAIRVMVGYTALDWTRIQRAGEQIDRRVDSTQIPSFGAPPGTVGVGPTFPGRRTDFWAQGINVGLELKY